jgi:hypothetical protein
MSKTETSLVTSLIALGQSLLPADTDEFLEGPQTYAGTIFGSEFGAELSGAKSSEDAGLLERAARLANSDIAAALYLTANILEGLRQARESAAVRRLRLAARLWSRRFVKKIGRANFVSPPSPSTATAPGTSRTRFAKERDQPDPHASMLETELLENQVLGPPVLASEPQTRGRGDGSVTNYAPLAKRFPRIKRPDHESLRTALVQRFPWLKDLVEGYLKSLIYAQHTRKPGFFLPPTLICGSPGAGKSALAQFIGTAASVPTRVYNAAASFEASDFGGLTRSWAGMAPGLPILDELDKISSSNAYGKITDALLAMLEPSTATAWRDPCLEVEADVSEITWIILANDRDLLPAPLLSRLKVLTASGPAGIHAAQLLQQWRKAAADEAGRPIETLPDLPPEAIALMASDLDQRRDLRRLRRAFMSLMTAIEWPPIH